MHRDGEVFMIIAPAAAACMQRCCGQTRLNCHCTQRSSLSLVTQLAATTVQKKTLRQH